MPSLHAIVTIAPAVDRDSPPVITASTPVSRKFQGGSNVDCCVQSQLHVVVQISLSGLSVILDGVQL